jgi:hypothetical protein
MNRSLLAQYRKNEGNFQQRERSKTDAQNHRVQPKKRMNILASVFPCEQGRPLHIQLIAEVPEDIVHANPFLLHGVALANGDRLILESL